MRWYLFAQQRKGNGDGIGVPCETHGWGAGVVHTYRGDGFGGGPSLPHVMNGDGSGGDAFGFVEEASPEELWLYGVAAEPLR